MDLDPNQVAAADIVDGLSHLPEEIFEIIATHISTNAGINVVEPSQSPWFRLRSVSRSICARANFYLILKYIEKHQVAFNDCATKITKLMSNASPNEIDRIEQYSNKLYDYRRRSEMIEAALSRYKRRQALLGDSKFDAILSDDERQALLNEDELNELIIMSSRVLAAARQFSHALDTRYERDEFYAPGVAPWAAPQPRPQPPPWAPYRPQPLPGYGPGEPDPDLERVPGFNEDDFDRDLNPFPDPFGPPPGIGGPLRPGLPKQPAPRFDPFNPHAPGPNNPFGGPRGGGTGGGGSGFPRFL